MAEIAPVLRARPACEGDVAYVDGPRVTLRKRLAMAAFVGDGHTTTALGREGRAAEDVAELRPHKVLASEPWVAAACDGRGPRWPAGLDRRWARRRVQDGLGGRLRWVEVGLGGVGRHRSRSRRGGHHARRPGRTRASESGFVN